VTVNNNVGAAELQRKYLESPAASDLPTCSVRTVSVRTVSVRTVSVRTVSVRTVSVRMSP
jgi:hypothetical protein